LFIENIYLKNFRGFKEKNIEFKKMFTVIAGENGSGKTAVLEGLCVALGGWLYGFDEIETPDKRNIYEADKRVIISKVNTSLLTQTPVEVKCEARIFNQKVQWSREIKSRKGHTTFGGLNEINKISNELNKKIFAAKDEDIILPVVAYYSAARLWNEPIQRSNKFNKEKIRLAGYKKAISFSNSIKDAMSYIDTLSYASEQDDKSLAEFKAVMEAIRISINNMLPNYSVEYNKKAAQICITNEKSESILFSSLSDGYRCIISLIIDISRRMAMLNPQLKEKAISETPGVILIDEIDLHLHPKWQKCVISDLKAIFPNVQFVATSHSPFIIQSLEEGELILIDKEINDDYSGESIEDISEAIMGVENPQYSHEKEEMYTLAQQYFNNLQDLTQKEQLNEIKVKLDILIAKYSKDPAYYAFLEQQFYAKKAELEVTSETCK